MYGLFCNTYDYYGWHDLVCVSSSKGDLIDHYKKIHRADPLLEGDEQEIADKKGRCHYVIEEIAVV